MIVSGSSFGALDIRGVLRIPGPGAAGGAVHVGDLLSPPPVVERVPASLHGGTGRPVG